VVPSNRLSELSDVADVAFFSGVDGPARISVAVARSDSERTTTYPLGKTAAIESVPTIVVMAVGTPNGVEMRFHVNPLTCGTADDESCGAIDACSTVSFE
jgi:hypothetical protein